MDHQHDNIIPFFRESETPQTPTDRLTSYWMGLCQDGRLPRQSDILPRPIRSLLGYVMLMDQIAPGHMQITFAGNRVERLFGSSTRGLPLSALFNSDSRVQLGHAISMCLDKTQIVHNTIVSTCGNTGTLCLMPLRDDEQRTTRAFVCFDMQNIAPMPHAKLHIKSTSTTPVGGAHPKILSAKRAYLRVVQ